MQNADQSCFSELIQMSFRMIIIDISIKSRQRGLSLAKCDRYQNGKVQVAYIFFCIYCSDSVTPENKTQTIGTGDDISSSSQPSPGFQPAWLGVPGQVSMADIVKMGRTLGKASRTPVVSTETSYLLHNEVTPNSSQHYVKHTPAPLLSESHHDLPSSQDPASKLSEIIHEPGIATSQHVSHDEWTLVEQAPAHSGSSVLQPSAASNVYAAPSNLHVDRAHLHLNSQSDEVQVTEAVDTVENHIMDHIGFASASSRQMQEGNSGVSSHFDTNSFENISSYQPHRDAFEHLEGIGGGSQLSIPNNSVSSVEDDVSIAVSSVAANLQHLSLQKEDLGAPPAEDNPAVVIPNHLQVSAADCSHLSFGSFGSGISATFSGSFASKPFKSNFEDASLAAADASSVEHLDTRSPEYFGDEQLRSTSDGNVVHGTISDSGSYDSSSSSQLEVMKQDTPEAPNGHQYNFPSSVPGYAFENTQQLNTAFSYAQTNSQMQNHAPFASVMEVYTNSLPSNFLPSSVQPVRESDIQYSPFLATQSMPTKYSNTVSSISSPTISMPEAVKPSGFSTPQPTPHTLPGTSIATGPALPHHLALHPYSQPTLPGHFANMISYPFLPHSYAYMPSAFQQAYAGNSTYHQSPTAVHSAGIKYTLPQYKNSVSASSLPQSAAIASGYGGFGSSTNIPGSFPLNPSATSASTTIGYDDIISSQYKEANHLLPLQQNESSALWLHGPSSRTMSAVPAGTYYSFQGQNQQHGGLRQAQQPSQHYGALGYPNFYHSQAAVSQEHQQQNPSEGTLSGSQGPPSKQSHQIWQQSY
ncbi:hypothetical protein HHK36_005036 [Tetracentron sinense]|uniref:GBF-interacting protein 1 N-terminal domain-containing protein n=1 Tax=Tetracentron sinense TaxID=13715 RepID=A0A834ZTC8_TETSI|nr:hypothetical protein HHK36_005036 [Tetracentron sinense]